MKKTLEHKPSGTKLVLDSSEIYPDDPGNGTPALVEFRRGCATYNYATSVGHVYTERNGDIDLPQDALDWLDSESIGNEIEAMYNSGRNGNW